MILVSNFRLIFLFVIALIAVHGIVKKIGYKKLILRMVFLLSVMNIMSFTLFPIFTHPDYTIISNYYRPLEYIGEVYTYALDNLVSGVLFFAPIGILLPLFIRSINTFPRAVGLGLVSYSAVEMFRLLISFVVGFRYINFVTDEIFLFTLGTLLGFVILKVSAPILSRFIDVNHLIKPGDDNEFPETRLKE